MFFKDLLEKKELYQVIGIAPNLQKMVISVNAVVRPVVLIPRIQAGGSHGRSLELPNDKACYQQ